MLCTEGLLSAEAVQQMLGGTVATSALHAVLSTALVHTHTHASNAPQVIAKLFTPYYSKTELH